MDGNGKKVLGLSPLTLTIVGITTATALLLIYHFVLSRFFNRQPLTVAVALGHQLPRLHRGDDHEMQSIENSVAELLPAYKYSKDISLIMKTQGGACTVCLSEFVEGEEVRVLPECLHPFHVDCIDMWLHSHSNCPLCRADTPVRHSVEFS